MTNNDTVTLTDNARISDFSFHSTLAVSHVFACTAAAQRLKHANRTG